MIDGKRVVVWTPYGREVTVSLLAEYLKRDAARGIVDEWWLCLNTDPDQISDLRYAYQLARELPFVRIKDRPAGLPVRRPKQRNTGYFYRYMADPDSVFIRLDDDIVYVHPEAMGHMARAKLEMEPSTCVHATMWNNSVLSWYFQQCGIIPAPGETSRVAFRDASDVREYVWPRVGGPHCMDPVGWADGRFAVAIHRLLIDRVRAGTADECFLYQDMPWKLGEQFSVSAFASLGSVYSSLPQPGVLVPDEEEHWHTVHRPRVIAQPNIILGNALVSHFTFFPQRGVVLGTDVLDQYRELAATAAALEPEEATSHG